MTKQWLDYTTKSHHTVALLFLTNMPRQIALVWMVYMQQRAKPLHLWCSAIKWANRNQQTWGSGTKTFDLRRQKRSFAHQSLKILQLAFWTDAFLHACVKITQIKLLKNRSWLVLLVRIHYSRPWFFDIPINSEVCIEDQTAEQASKQGCERGKCAP